MSYAANANTPTTEAPEVITVEPGADAVMCDGGGGPLGHPQVWYSFDGKDQVECLYCDRLFVKSVRNPL